MAPNDAIISILPFTKEKEDIECRPPPERRSDKDGNPMTKWGEQFSKLRERSFLIRYSVYIVPIGILIAIPIILGYTVTPNVKIGKIKLSMFFIWIMVLWVSFWLMKLFVKSLAHIFRFSCGIISTGMRKYSDVFTALETPIALFLWLLVCYLTYYPVLYGDSDHSIHHDEDSDDWERIVHKIFGAFMGTSIIFLIEKTLIQYISIDYHRKQFESKIRESKRNFELLGHLYDASRERAPEYTPRYADHDARIRDEEMSAGNPLELFQSIGRLGGRATSDFATNAFGNIARDITGKQVMDPNSAHSIITRALETERSSSALAHRLWLSFVGEDESILSREHLLVCLGTQRHSIAEEAFNHLDRDENGDVTFEEFNLTIRQWGRDRDSINSSIHDVDHAVNALDALLKIVVFLVAVIIFVGFFNASFYDGLSKWYAGVMATSWLFAATFQEILGSCVFIFVKHPYDILDRVDIAGGEMLVVEQINLLFTVFHRVQDHKMVQIPNINLNSAAIHNVSRSQPMRERLTLHIAFDTPAADIELFKSSLEVFVQQPANKRDFQPNVETELILATELGKLELIVDFGYKSNLANESLRTSRRNKFYCILIDTVRKLPITGPGGGGPSLGDVGKPSFSVSITPDEALAQKKKVEEDRATKRQAFVPPTLVDTGVSSGIDIQRA